MSYDFGSQLLTYHTIRIYIELHGYPPTKLELSQMRGMHITNVYEHLKQLESRGYIKRDNGWRNIELLKREPEQVNIDVQPKTMTVKRREQYEARKNRTDDMYALYENGMSMHEIGKHYGITRARIHHLFTEFGYAVIRRQIDIDYPLIYSQYEAGRSLTDLAFQYNISGSYLGHLLKAEGYELHSPGRRKIWTPERLAVIKADYESGMTQKEIGRKYGVSQAVIGNVMSRYGIERRSLSQAVRMSRRRRATESRAA